jgi:hypothetical protein
VSNGDVGIGTSLQVVNGSPAISYAENLNEFDSSRVLKYVRATYANGSAWGTPFTVDDNGGDMMAVDTTGLSIINGNPAVAYGASNDWGIVRFVRAADANGSSWGGFNQVTSSGLWYLNLLTANGNPAVAFTSGAGVRFNRSTDQNGGAWGSSIQVDSDGHDMAAAMLATSPALPAIAYQYLSTHTLRFIKASNSDGSSWGASVAVDSHTNCDIHAMAIVTGRPALVYVYHDQGILKFIRANNADGSSWPASALTIQAGVWVDYPEAHTVSLAVINGLPAVAFCKYNNGDVELWFIQATASDGSAWGQSEKVDGVTGSDRGTSNSLAQINGCPAISYRNSTDKDLMFAIKQ